MRDIPRSSKQKEPGVEAKVTKIDVGVMVPHETLYDVKADWTFFSTKPSIFLQLNGPRLIFSEKKKKI